MFKLRCIVGDGGAVGQGRGPGGSALEILCRGEELPLGSGYPDLEGRKEVKW